MIGCFPSISNKVVGPGFPQFFQVECFITPISRVYFTSVTMEGVHLEANFCVFFPSNIEWDRIPTDAGPSKLRVRAMIDTQGSGGP